MDKIDVLVVGGGGREHALVWKIRQSPLVDKIYAALGNPGMAEDGAECIPIQADNIIGLRDFALEKAIGLTIVGPEGPLADGIVDVFEATGGLCIFGPSQSGAQIEYDKCFAMWFMQEHGILTGWHKVFTDMGEVFDFVREMSISSDRPLVIKNPYLAGGKGSFICEDNMAVGHALAQIREQQTNRGILAHTFLVMEYLEGEEVSITAITDGEHLVYLSPSQDHKRLKDGDQGPMTGGMGAIAPAPYITAELQTVIHERIMLPTIRAMAEEGRPYKGVLYAGLILTADGPKVLEFNARFGDPEAQVILPLLKTDLVEIMLAVCERRLNEVQVGLYDDRAAACVVLASDGYGYYDEFPTGFPIGGTWLAPRFGGQIFQAGTTIKDGQLVTAGGRVLGVTTTRMDLRYALAVAYDIASAIDFRGMQYRRDIGQKALRHLAGQKK